jgi:hypothetical protein
VALPFILPSASQLIGETYLWSDDLDEAENWFRTTIQVAQVAEKFILWANDALEFITQLRQQSESDEEQAELES